MALPWKSSEKKSAALRFAERFLRPGTLVKTTSGSSEAYVFPRLRLSEQTRIAGEGTSQAAEEPFIIIASVLGDDSTYCYVIGRETVGWLPTWEGDGVFEMIQRAQS